MIRYFVICLICLLQFSTTAFAENKSADAATDIQTVLEGVEKAMGTMQTLSAEFVQKKRMAMFSMPVKIGGTIHIQEPDRFAWIVKSPVPYALIINGSRVQKWDKTNGSQTLSLDDNPMFREVVDQITFWFSGNYTACTKDYNASVVQQAPLILAFEPKEENPASQMLKKIVLSFKDDWSYLHQITLHEQNGDITELTFSNVLINSTIDPSVWTVK